jgi:hypothetical protein
MFNVKCKLFLHPVGGGGGILKQTIKNKKWQAGKV